MDDNIKRFIEKYNHVKIDEYLNIASKITDFDNRLNYWIELLNQYKSDLNELRNVNSLYPAIIYGNNDLRYKKGNFLSANIETICNQKIDDLKTIIKKSDIRPDNKIIEKCKESSFHHDYFIILEMLMTNEVKIVNDKFIYQGVEYQHGNYLNTTINKDKRYNPPKRFTQYLNDFRSKTGMKYLLEIVDKDGNRNFQNIKRMRKFKEYVESKNLNIVNQDFTNVFRQIENLN